MSAAVWGAEEPESSTTAQSHLSKEFGLGGEAETAVRISDDQLSVCGACAVTHRRYCHVLHCHCQLCPWKGPHSAVTLRVWQCQVGRLEALRGCWDTRTCSRGGACQLCNEKPVQLGGPGDVRFARAPAYSEGTTEKEPLASKHRARSLWDCSAGSLRNLVLLFLQFIPTQSKVVSFNAVEHNYRPDRLWQVGWDIYSCSRQMLKWFCIGKCCLWNVLS